MPAAARGDTTAPAFFSARRGGRVGAPERDGAELAMSPAISPAISDDLARFTATALIDGYRTKSFSPVAVLDRVLATVDQVEPKLNGFVLIDRDAARAAAKASEQRWQQGEPKGLLDGVPVSVKDLILAKGWPTLRGSRITDPDQPWTEDAPAVARLREHGAVILGKTTTPEFGHKGVTDSAVSGTTRNPWNPELTPGGSSGGAAVAVATGMGPLAIGTDGGGSVRIPASFTGIYGLKPHFGRVPAYPLSPFGTVAHLGPMTRSVADAALLLTVIAEPDLRDWHALPYQPETDFREDLDSGVRGLRVAFSPRLGLDGIPIDDEVAALVTAAARRIEALGAVVEEADPHWPHDPAAVFSVYWQSGAAKLVDSLTAEARALLDPTLLGIAERGMAYDGLAIKTAEMERGAIGLSLNRFFETYDLLLCPTMPITAFPVDQPYPSDAYAERPTDWTPFTFPFNLSRQPAASVPCGFTEAGLPVGLQIIGRAFGEVPVLCASRAFERAEPWADRWPEV